MQFFMRNALVKVLGLNSTVCWRNCENTLRGRLRNMHNSTGHPNATPPVTVPAKFLQNIVLDPPSTHTSPKRPFQDLFEKV